MTLSCTPRGSTGHPSPEPRGVQESGCATRSQRMGVTMSDSRVQPASRTLLAHICAGAERLPLISADERRCWPVMCWDTRPH